MTKWNYVIDLNKVIDELNKNYNLFDQKIKCPNEVKEAIIKEIEKAPPLHKYIPCIKKIQKISDFNIILDSIYNTADNCSVWCGL